MAMISRRTLLGAGAVTALAACTRGRRDGSLTWWAIGTTGENAPLLVPPFVRATGIDVDVQAVPWTGAHEKLLTGYAGGSLPDVMMLDSTWLPELSLVGALAPPPAGSPLLHDQYPGALASVQVDGRARAVPWTADAWVQFYRRDLVAEVGYAAPPLDRGEWMRMARSIVRRHPDRYATLHLLDWPEPLFAFAAQQPEPLLCDHDTRGNFSTPGFRAALAFYKTIYDERLSPAITGAEVGDTYIAFRRGWFAILPSDTVAIGDLRRRAAMIPPDLWGAVATPGPTGAGDTVARGACLAVSHTAHDPARAWRLIEYLAAAPTQRRLYGITGDLPTRPSAWSGGGLAGDPVAQTFAQAIARGIAPPAVPEWQRIVTEVQLVAEHMVRGEYGVDVATREMDARVDRILAKRRWLLDRSVFMTRQARAGVAFTLPVLLATTIVLVVPTLGALLLSVTDFDIYALADLRDLRFVGAGNYAELLRTPLFWRAVGNTALFAAIGVPAAIGTSLVTALLLASASVRWKPLWRLLLFAPYVTTLVATALVWRYVLDTQSGLLNYALSLVGIAPVDWLGNPRTSIPATLIFIVWKAFGYNMLVFSAALATVPQELHEAARLDGAGVWARFRHVTLPAIAPALLLACVISVASFLQVFTEPYVMTHGGPAQSTETILYFMYDQGFTWWNLGMASAVAVLLFAAILVLTAVQTRLARRREWL